VTFLSILFIIAFAIFFLAHSYAAPALHNIHEALSSGANESDTFWKAATIVRGPDNIKVVALERTKIEEGREILEANVTVTMRLAVDTDFIMGFQDSNNDTWFREKWKGLGRWAVRKLGVVTAFIDDFALYPSNATLAGVSPIVTIKPHGPISIPLYPGLTELDHQHPPSLQPILLNLTVYPSQNVSLMLDFFKETWFAGFASIKIQATNLFLHGGEPSKVAVKWWQFGLWRSWFKFSTSYLIAFLNIKIPPFGNPSSPQEPGSELPKLSDLLVLESFRISSPFAASINNFPGASREISLMSNPKANTSPNLLIVARASLPHPFPSLASRLDIGEGFSNLPFTVSLPLPPGVAPNIANGLSDSIPVVTVLASPEFNATHIRIHLSGHVLPLSNSTYLPGAISVFVNNYLSYRPSPIAISSPLYPLMEINANFPPPSHKLEILRNVKIEDMNIHPGPLVANLPSFGMPMMDILASAKVHAQVVLPEGIHIDLTVKRLWVDCLIYDGEVPPDLFSINSFSFPTPTKSFKKLDDPPLPEPLPLPTPLPPLAFGRITPRAWLNATSSSHPIREQPDDIRVEDGRSVYVKADVVDVPLAVLPGRQNELTKFVTKVLFSTDPVVAGVRGIAAVGVTVPGLTSSSSGNPRIEGSELILTGLPFEGNVNVGGHSAKP